jgi:hypothetical protein
MPYTRTESKPAAAILANSSRSRHPDPGGNGPYATVLGRTRRDPRRNHFPSHSNRDPPESLRTTPPYGQSARSGTEIKPRRTARARVDIGYPGSQTPLPMDSLKLILAATAALLLGALAMSWVSMKNGIANAPAGEVERMNKQIRELRAEHDRLVLEKQVQQLKASTPPLADPVTTAAEIAAIKQRLQDQETRNAQQAATGETTPEQDPSANDPASRESRQRRERLISQALLMGRVKEYVKDPQLGSFITFDVIMPELVQAGTVLGVRRRAGILAEFKVSEVSPEGGIANPVPGAYGEADIRPGDELIVPPL